MTRGDLETGFRLAARNDKKGGGIYLRNLSITSCSPHCSLQSILLSLDSLSHYRVISGRKFIPFALRVLASAHQPDHRMENKD